MKKLLILVTILLVTGMAAADLDPQRVLPSEIVGVTESSNICGYWGFDADKVFDRSGLVAPAEELHVHDNGSGTMAMFENRDWNGWNSPYCIYQTNDHPFWPGDLGTSNPNFLGDGIVVEANWDRDNPTRQNTDTQTMYGHSNYVDGYEYNCTMAWIMVEFDAVKSLRDMHWWNFNEWNDQARGWRDVDMHYSVDGTNWLYKDLPLLDPQPTPGSYSPAANLNVALGVDAQYIVFTCYDEQTMDNSGGGYNGVSEIQFNTPEPTTMGLLALGALMLRKRR